MTRLGDTTLEEQDDFVRYCDEKGVRHFIVGLFNYKGDINSSLPVPRYGCEHVTRLDILASGKITLCCMDQDGQYGWGDVREQSVLELYRHATAKKYRDLHASGRRREIEPCGTCNLFWPLFTDMSPIEAVRTGIEYCTYIAKYRPIGKKAPQAAAGGDTLVSLRLKHQDAGARSKAQSHSSSEPEAAEDPAE
jgi:hypothetical protein